LSSPLEVSEIAAELKEYAKSIAASVYVVDKRRSAVSALNTQGCVKGGEPSDIDSTSYVMPSVS
jgi:hypothetical protein